MKKYLLLVVVLLVSACSPGQQTVTMYKMTSFSEADLESTQLITERADSAAIQKAINKAVKQRGIVDMSDPEFTIEIGDQSFYLWIQEEAGTIMNLEDTHTIYSLKKKNAKDMKKIVDHYFQ